MRFRYRRIAIWLFVIGSITIWYRLSERNLSPKISGFSHDIPYALSLGKTDIADALGKLNNIANEAFKTIDQHHNRWNKNSELSRLNRAKPFVEHFISSDLSTLLAITDQAVKLTEGRFDPTIQPAWSLWKKSLEMGFEPDLSELQSLSGQTGWHRLNLKKNRLIKQGLIELDLGGIAKGHAVDLIAEHLKKEGFANFYIEWGGEIRAYGKRADNTPWRVGVEQSSGKESKLEIHKLRNAAIATSGSDRQFWSVGRKTYTHILNPMTLTPLELEPSRPVSCTVLAKTCALADALATAGMLFGSCREAIAWFAQLNSSDFYCVWINDEKFAEKFDRRSGKTTSFSFQ